MSNLSAESPGPKPAPKLPAQDWDVLLAAALDSAERAEAAARDAGSSRLTAASIRHLRFVVRQLAVAGTPNALADPPADRGPSTPIQLAPRDEHAS